MNEELDELASAYVDGEASPDEIARIEGDPELLSLVEEFRALRQSSLPGPSIDSELQEQHISAALAAFDELHASAPSLMAVEDASSAAPAERSVGSDSDGTVSSLEARRARRLPPPWLLNAAAAVVIVGGVGFALTQLPDSGGDDAAVQTFDETELDAEAADLSSASGAGSADASAESGEAEEMAPFSAQNTTQAEDRETEAEDDAMADDAADDAMADDAADEAMEEESADGTEDAGESGDIDQAPPAEPAGVFAGTETASEVLADLVGTPTATVDDVLSELELLPAGAAPCFEAVEGPGELLGFLSVQYGSDLADLLIFDADGTPDSVLVDASCAVLSAD